MDGKFYGWIGKTKKHIKQPGNSGTKTAQIIKKYLGELGAEPAVNEGIQAKNLYKKGDKYYYILSIDENVPFWAPYCFIDNLNKPVYFILSIDNNDHEISLYSFEYKGMNLSKSKNFNYYLLKTKFVSENYSVNHVSLDEQSLKTALEGILNNE